MFLGLRAKPLQLRAKSYNPDVDNLKLIAAFIDYCFLKGLTWIMRSNWMYFKDL